MLVAGFVYVTQIVVSEIYFAGRKIAKKKNTPASDDDSDSAGAQFISWLQKKCLKIHADFFPANDEKIWLEKLHGIYNDYVYKIPKPEQFSGELKNTTKQQAELFMNIDENKRNYLPQSSEFMDASARLPLLFKLRNFSIDGEDEGDGDISTSPSGYFRWQYHIPGRFYWRTHLWLTAFIAVGVLWLIFIIFLNAEFYKNVGSAGLVLGAFCSWTGVYMGILYIDYGVLRRRSPLRPGMPATHALYPFEAKPARPAKYARGWNGGQLIIGWFERNVSLRALLLIWLVTSSIFNTDHDVRYYYDQGFCKHAACKDNGRPGWKDTLVVVDQRPDMKQHFTDWVSRYVQDSTNMYYDVQTQEYFWPVVFLCAEGGAIRTGAFTSMMLGCLQDSLAVLQKQSNGTPFDFRKTIYASSGVSGGSLGLAAFNALAYIDPKSWEETGLQQKSREFFNEDYLSAVIGKLFYGDVFQLWWPWHVNALDRAVALESSLECGYVKVTGKNTFSKDFARIYGRDNNYPALVINTTEVESGMQCWLSSVRMDTSIAFASQRDLCRDKLRRSIRLTTAINFSTRFPLFCPAAAVSQGGGQKFHYVDGGYYENSGAATMLEILQSIRPVIDSFGYFDSQKVAIKIRPYVLMMRFGEEDSDGHTDINFANEVTEILNGIYNTRAGRLALAGDALRKYVEDNTLNGSVVQLHLAPNGKQIPMSWVFSNNSMSKLDTFVHCQWRDRNKNKLNRFVFVDTLTYKRN